MLITSLCAQTSYSEQKWIQFKDDAAFDASRSSVIDTTARVIDDTTIVNGCPIGFVGDNCDTGTKQNLCILIYTHIEYIYIYPQHVCKHNQCVSLVVFNFEHELFL